MYPFGDFNRWRKRLFMGSNQDTRENLKAACKLVTIILRRFPNNVSFVMNYCQVGGQLYICIIEILSFVCVM
jgi:hypothetical protein